MHSLFRHTPVDSPILIILTIVFFFSSSIYVFSVRYLQAKRLGDLPPDEPMLPEWIVLIAWLHWGLHVAFVILNWKYAVFLFVIRFILSVLPVLEIIGNILMRPFRPK